MAQDKKSSDEILKELFNSIHEIAPSSEDESDGDKKVVVKKEKKSKSSYDSSYCSKSKHKKKKKSKKSSTKYSLHIRSGSDKKSKKSSSKSSSESKVKKEKSIKVEKELDLIEVLKKEVIESVPCSVIAEPESIALPPLPTVGSVSIKQEPTSPKKPAEKDFEVVKDSEKPILNDELVESKLGETYSSESRNDCGDEPISKVADVFEEDLLECGDKLLTKEKPKKTIQIQNLKNSSVLEDAAKSKAKSEELKNKKRKKQEEGELTDDLSDISSTSDSELDSTDDDAEASKTTSKPLEDKKKEEHKEEKDKGRPKKKKKKDKHRRKDRRGEDGGSRRHSEHRSKRSDDTVKVERTSRHRSRSRSKISGAPSNRRSPSYHTDVSRLRERRWGSRSRSRSRSLEHGRKRSHSPRSKRRRTSREPDDLRSKLKWRKSSERDRSGDRRKRSKGSQERSRSRQEKDEYYIDKGKLLEIARKNALSMLRQGQVGGDVNKVVHITAGGKTVDELTDFCKHLSRKEASGMESVSSDSSSDESEKPFHHPFKLKERPSQIIMNIRNCVPLPPKSHQEKATEILRVQFPVSSGQHHRKTESEWVPVSPKRTETKTLLSASKAKDTAAPLAIEAPPVVVAGPVVPKYPTVYPTPAEKRAVDISAVISERLAAIRKDYDTPSSSVFTSTRSWEAPHTSGLFTGSTGAKVLTPTELASGQQAWARKNDRRHQPPEPPTPSLLENGCTPEMLALKMLQVPLALPSGSNREALNKKYGFSTELPDLPTGQLVCITDLKVKGHIVKKLDEPRSYLIETKEGRKVVSDRFHLVPL
uniref:Protein SON n=1 Tax=Lygus hesperus TaxID=30085 RepID=A0A0A9YXP3_LYGHE